MTSMDLHYDMIYDRFVSILLYKILFQKTIIFQNFSDKCDMSIIKNEIF